MFAKDQETDTDRRCVLCGLREAAAVSDESRRRDVSGDPWRLTEGGQAVVLLTRRAAQQQADYQQWGAWLEEGGLGQ
jgi:hypothetical protein